MQTYCREGEGAGVVVAVGVENAALPREGRLPQVLHLVGGGAVEVADARGVDGQVAVEEMQIAYESFTVSAG